MVAQHGLLSHDLNLGLLIPSSTGVFFSCRHLKLSLPDLFVQCVNQNPIELIEDMIVAEFTLSFEVQNREISQRKKCECYRQRRSAAQGTIFETLNDWMAFLHVLK